MDRFHGNMDDKKKLVLISNLLGLQNQLLDFFTQFSTFIKLVIPIFLNTT